MEQRTSNDAILPSLPPAPQVRSVAPDPSAGQWLLSGGDDGSVRLWEVRTGRCMRSWALGEPVSYVAWCPNPALRLAAVVAGSRVALLPTGGCKDGVIKCGGGWVSVSRQGLVLGGRVVLLPAGVCGGEWVGGWVGVYVWVRVGVGGAEWCCGPQVGTCVYLWCKVALLAPSFLRAPPSAQPESRKESRCAARQHSKEQEASTRQASGDNNNRYSLKKLPLQAPATRSRRHPPSRPCSSPPAQISPQLHNILTNI